ncbi:MAG TPA: hypothetical protein VMJ14_15480 [Burkholderiales bacterium]|nr:hypothetical protein [Burkholderiales bacterium]
MLGLTTLGAIHTAISLVALVSGVWAFARDKEIVPANRLGQLYLAATVLTAATALGIYQHGGFRIGHLFAVLTLMIVAIGALASATTVFRRASRYVQAVCFSSTMLLHMITGTAETVTRLPPGAPLITAGNAFLFPYILWTLVLLFLVALGFQLRWLHMSPRRR